MSLYRIGFEPRYLQVGFFKKNPVERFAAAADDDGVLVWLLVGYCLTSR